MSDEKKGNTQEGTLIEGQHYIKLESGCWVWKRAVMNTGYGILRHDGRNQLAHRVSYELAKGKIPPGMQIDHLCRHPTCINPDHLEVVTQAENMRRGYLSMSNKMRALERTHCKRGHELSGENVIVTPTHRSCRQCINERAKKHYQKKNGPRKTSAERLSAKTKKNEDGCLLFTGSLSPEGYGRIGNGKQTTLAHRLSYELANGPIPEGMTILHTCPNKGCVNPEHLKLATWSEVRTDVRRAPAIPKTHCKHGHELSSGNIYLYNGKRQCLICKQRSTRKAQDKSRMIARLGHDNVEI